jgi:hypothetical protein
MHRVHVIDSLIIRITSITNITVQTFTQAIYG